MTSQLKVHLTDQDFQEIFALFSSPSDDELHWVYDPASTHYFEKEGLGEEYYLTQEKREFAGDAWRAVTYFLHRRGYTLLKDDKQYSLGLSSGYSTVAD